jgi:UDP-N-acetyl-2-amino-2-deoxyglucuronate dehydrogenase
VKEGSKTQQVGVGVVGLGMGLNHARAFAEYEKAKLVAVCDIRSDLLKRACDEFNVKGYLSYDEMLQDPEIDAVAIVTPSYEHATMGIYAALHGKHALVEKPIATDLTAGDWLIRVCKERGVKLAGIFQSRLDPMNIRMKQIVDEGKIGKVYQIEGIVRWWRDDKAYYHANKQVEMWKGTWFGEGGGSLVNQGIHTVDQLYWMMGEVDTIYGQYNTVSHSIQAEDFCTALIRFKNGAVGYLVCTTCTPEDMQETRVSIYGDKGAVSKKASFKGMVAAGDQLTIKIGEKPAETLTGQTLKTDSLTIPKGGPHTWQCRDFIDSIIENHDPIVTGESALKAVEIITAVYQSALQGKPVKIPLPRY